VCSEPISIITRFRRSEASGAETDALRNPCLLVCIPNLLNVIFVWDPLGRQKMTFSSGSATGLAICKGAWLGRPDEAWKHKCARWAQCPSCERKRASKRAHEIKERIKVAMHEYGNELQVGVLTVTLPGVKHESGIRYASLKEQYDYAIARTTLPGHRS